MKRGGFLAFAYLIILGFILVMAACVSDAPVLAARGQAAPEAAAPAQGAPEQAAPEQTAPEPFVDAEKTENVLPVPLISADDFQETVYSGEPQSVQAQSDPELPLVIWYFASEEDFRSGRNGATEPPAEPGLYFVRVNCAPGYGYTQPEDRLVRFNIKKAPVEISAAAVQSAPFNGNPRRVQADARPALPLSYSYYPTPELRRAAVDNFFRAEESASFSAALSRFTRVASAPVEQGVYYVLVYFPGNDRYEAALKEVDFTIGPPLPRNR